jgi:hypothetical protein
MLVIVVRSRYFFDSQLGLTSRRQGFLLQAMDGLADGFIEPLSTPFQMRNNSSAHARIPEFLQMIGNGRNRIAFTLR